MNNPKLLALCFTLLPLFTAHSADSSDRIVACFKKELYAINADGSGMKQLTDFKVPGHAPTCKYPSQTHNKETIYWAYDPEFHGGMSLFKMQSKDKITRLTVEPRNKDAATWDTAVSPDGKYTAFTANRNGKYHIYRVDNHSKNIINLSNNDFEANHAKWSPNSKQLVYMHYGKQETGQIYIMNADGSDKRALLSSDIKKGRPAWSPDGKSIAYLEKPTGKTQLWTIDIHSGQRTLVSEKVNQYSTISWSGDSKRLVFIDNKELLSTIKIDGSDQTRLSDRKGFYEPFWY